MHFREVDWAEKAESATQLSTLPCKVVSEQTLAMLQTLACMHYRMLTVSVCHTFLLMMTGPSWQWSPTRTTCFAPSTSGSNVSGSVACVLSSTSSCIIP